LGGGASQHAMAGQLLASGPGCAVVSCEQFGMLEELHPAGSIWVWAGRPGETRSRLTHSGAPIRTTHHCSPNSWRSSGASSRTVTRTAGSRPSRAKGPCPRYGCSGRAPIAHSSPERWDFPSDTAGTSRPQTVSPRSRRIVSLSARHQHCRSRTQSSQWELSAPKPTKLPSATTRGVRQHCAQFVWHPRSAALGRRNQTGPPGPWSVAQEQYVTGLCSSHIVGSPCEDGAPGARSAHGSGRDHDRHHHARVPGSAAVIRANRGRVPAQELGASGEHNS
jgi:hypothetical protein